MKTRKKRGTLKFILSNFSLAANVLIQITNTITPPKKTKTKRYKNQETLTIALKEPKIKEYIINTIPNLIGCDTLNKIVTKKYLIIIYIIEYIV